MSTNVGGIKFDITGNSGQAVLAVQQTEREFEKLALKANAAAAALAHAQNSGTASAGAIRLLAQESAKASAAIGQTGVSMNAVGGHLTKLRGGFAAVTTSIGAVAPAANGAMGALGGMLNLVGGAGGIGLAVGLVGAGVAYLVTQWQAEKEALAEASKATEAHSLKMADLDAKIRAVGKSEEERARIFASAAATAATTTYLSGDGAESIKEEMEIRDEIRRNQVHFRLGLKDEKATLVDNAILYERIAELEKQRAVAVGRINEEYSKTIQLAKREAEEKAKAKEQAEWDAAMEAEANRLAAEAERRRAAAAAAAEAARKAKLEHDTKNKTIEMATTSTSEWATGIYGMAPGDLALGMAMELKRDAEAARFAFENLLRVMKDVRDMAEATDVGGSVAASATSPLDGINWSGVAAMAQATDDAASDGSFSAQARARREGASFAMGAIQTFQSGGGAMHVATAIAPAAIGGMLGAFTSIVDEISRALQAGFTAVVDKIGNAIDFVAGGSKIGGVGGKGAQAATGVMGGIMAAGAGGMLSPITAAPLLAVAGAAGLAAGGLAMVGFATQQAILETKSYAKVQNAINGIISALVVTMEPVFASLLPSIGILGLVLREAALGLAQPIAMISEVFGSTLFNVTRALAFTMGQAALQISASYIGIMKASNAFNLAMATFLQSVGAFETASGFLQAFIEGEANVVGAQTQHGELASFVNGISQYRDRKSVV